MFRILASSQSGNVSGVNRLSHVCGKNCGLLMRLLQLLKTWKSARNWIKDLHDMQVEDICGKEELYKLDNTGFQYGREVAKHTSFNLKFLNDDEIEREYSESIELIKRVTGATKLSSSITLRWPLIGNDVPMTTSGKNIVTT
ncbi:hypothetical protein C8R48DRAFT_790297 [Suillus tomentosus]|nr:hypothetical protein C8R48DRAFT_790297 [Suillus tomentosus]